LLSLCVTARDEAVQHIYFGDKSTIIWWNGRIILLFLESWKVCFFNLHNFANSPNKNPPTRRTKIRQLAEQKSANSPNKNPPTRRTKNRQLAE